MNEPPAGLIIRAEQPDDDDAVRRLLTAAFDGPAEARLVDDLRADGDALVSLVAEIDGAVVGHILFSPLPIRSAHRVSQAAALAPLAVAPAHQGKGVGSRLARDGIDACRRLGLDGVVVLGAPAYYGRFGFSAEAAKDVGAPYAGGPAFMALALRPDVTLAGEARYARAFAALG